jgi:hypothetical protein
MQCGGWILNFQRTMLLPSSESIKPQILRKINPYIFHPFHSYVSQDGSFNTVSGYGLDDQCSIGFLFSHHNQTIYKAHPASYLMDTGGYLPDCNTARV